MAPGSRQLDPGGLQLRVFVEGVQGFVAADARLLIATERHRDVIGVVAIDVDHSSAQRARRAVDLFAAHDARVLEQAHAIYRDETKLVQTMQEAAEELQSLFEADQAAEPQETKDARK